jgi:hypothetical protein
MVDGIMAESSAIQQSKTILARSCEAAGYRVNPPLHFLSLCRCHVEMKRGRIPSRQ